MMKFKLLPISFLFLLFVNCGSESNKKAKDFELQVYEDSVEVIKPFKVANIMPYFSDGKWGYANKQGEIVIPCKYESCGFFSDGMAWVEKDMKFGFMDTTGQMVIKNQYLSAENFENGLAIVKSNKYKGIIDKTNKLLIPFEYEELFFAGKNLVCFKQNQQWGVLSVTKGQLMNPIYDYPFTYENGFAVVNRDRKQGVINRAGKEVVLCKYDKVIQTRGNYFIVMKQENYKNKLYGVVDSTGKIIIPISQKLVEEAINNSFIINDDKGNLVVNNKLDTLVNYGFTNIKAGNTNLLAASVPKGWGFIDLKGDTIIPFQFADAKPFTGNFAIVKKTGAYGLINNLGETVIPFEFENIEYADKNILRVYNKERAYGFYNTKGEKLTDCIYDDIDYSINPVEAHMQSFGNSDEVSKFGQFVNNYAIIGINGRMGAIDKAGKEIIKPYYHSLTTFDENGLAIAEFNGAEALVNDKGKEITGLKYECISRDAASGYYYANYKLQNENRNWNYVNNGYFNLDGKYFSNVQNGVLKIETEEEIILTIRKEYQRIASAAAKEKSVSVSIDDNIIASKTTDRMIVTDKKNKISYEYYFDDKLNSLGPFFILKTDKSSGEAKLDRFYYKSGEIVRWIDQSGKQRIVANGPYAPEDKEHFVARNYMAEFENQLLLKNNIHNKEVAQIDELVGKIDSDISAGKYKKGDVYNEDEGSGGSGHEEYVDNKGQFIYKYDHSGSDYHSASTKEYYKNGELIYSTEYSYQSSNLYDVGEMGGGERSEYTRQTYRFKDGTVREYREESFGEGKILKISENK